MTDMQTSVTARWNKRPPNDVRKPTCIFAKHGASPENAQPVNAPEPQTKRSSSKMHKLDLFFFLTRHMTATAHKKKVTETEARGFDR